MAPLSIEDSIRPSFTYDAPDHYHHHHHHHHHHTPLKKLYSQHDVRTVEPISHRRSTISTENVEKVKTLVGSHQSFCSDDEIMRRIPRVADVSRSFRMSAKNSSSTLLPCHDEKVGQKRSTRISFEAHPFGQINRKTRISFEVHPFLIFGDVSEE